MATEKALATADFRVHGEGWNGPFDETVHAELLKSGAFDYGNGTCMVFEWSNGNTQSYDTRYENVTPENFAVFVKKVLNASTKDTIKADLIKK